MRLPDAPRSRAVLIGTGHYQDHKLHNLPGALGNVTDLAAHLMHEQWGAFGSGSCATLLDPTNVSEVGESLAETAEQAEDTLLVYYAGHGLLDSRGELFLGLSTTNSARVAYTAVPFGFIQRAFLDSPASSRILILDCCFSGRAIEAMTDPSSVVSGQIEISGVYTLTSAPANQPANAPAGERHTAFTGELLRLLHHGVPAGDELITLGQVYTHLLTALNARGLPKPQRRGTGTSDRLALARNPAWVARERPQGQRPSLPGDVVELLDDPLPATRRGAIARLAHLIRTRDPEYAQPAFTALVHLSDDDSRMVAATAKSALLELEHEKVSEGRPEPAATEPTPRARTHRRTRLSAGISFGTTNSAIAVLDNGRPAIVPSSEGKPTIPSIVAFAKNGQVLVGQPAKDRAVTNVDRTVRSVKRHMGTDWNIEIDGKAYTAQEIAARVLLKLRRDAEEHLRENVRDVVITVPAYFDDAQRQATKEAGQIAGLNVLRIVSEPTAAALAYGLDRGEKEHTVLVFDLGGGTFDVSLLEIGDGVIEVRATNGDNHLGGDDWDQRIVVWLVDKVKAATGIDLNRDRLAMDRVREAAEQAKIALSSSTTAEIHVPYITVDAARNPVHLDEVLTRAEFERITSDLLDRARAPFNNVIKDASIKVGDIDCVILVGGSTRMPAVMDSLREWLGAVRHGIQLIKFTDEVVALGAALEAGTLTGEVKDVLSLDVTPLSLGIETKGGVFTKLIERNTTIPTKRSEIFSTADDGQTTVGIQVFQGEREIAVHNKKLGTFDLTGISPAPRGVPQIEVTFDIDANGIVHVSAKDLDTGTEQSITVSGGSALSTADIDRMSRDAEADLRGAAR